MTPTNFQLLGLPRDTLPNPYQVYALPELNAVLTLRPVSGSRRMDGKITVNLTPDAPLRMATPAWTTDACWQDGTLSLRFGRRWEFHETAQGTLARVHAEQQNPTVIPDEERYDNIAEMCADRLMIPALIHEQPPVWLVKTGIDGAQGGNLSGTMMLTCLDLTIPGRYDEEDEPVDQTIYRIDPQQAARLPAGTVFGRDGVWAH